jgi:GNAT superfamily N-acetyltransferase
MTVHNLRVVPANEASWEDLKAVFGLRDYPAHCYCQRYKIGNPGYSGIPVEARRAAQHADSGCGDPAAEETTGLVAYLDREPVGFVAVEPRVAYPRLTQTVWNGRREDRADPGIWSVTCFTVRKGYRRRGLTYPLAAATVPYARDRGARVLEGYPMDVPAGYEVTWNDYHVGSLQAFVAAGFEIVHRPSKRRVVVRVTF